MDLTLRPTFLGKPQSAGLGVVAVSPAKMAQDMPPLWRRASRTQARNARNAKAADVVEYPYLH